MMNEFQKWYRWSDKQQYRQLSLKRRSLKSLFRSLPCFGTTHFFYKQPHFQVEPRVAMKISEMRLKVAIRLLSIFGIEAQGC